MTEDGNEGCNVPYKVYKDMQ